MSLFRLSILCVSLSLVGCNKSDSPTESPNPQGGGFPFAKLVLKDPMGGRHLSMVLRGRGRFLDPHKMGQSEYPSGHRGDGRFRNHLYGRASDKNRGGYRQQGLQVHLYGKLRGGSSPENHMAGFQISYKTVELRSRISGG